MSPGAPACPPSSAPPPARIALGLFSLLAPAIKHTSITVDRSTHGVLRAVTTRTSASTGGRVDFDDPSSTMRYAASYGATPPDAVTVTVLRRRWRQRHSGTGQCTHHEWANLWGVSIVYKAM